MASERKELAEGDQFLKGLFVDPKEQRTRLHHVDHLGGERGAATLKKGWIAQENGDVGQRFSHELHVGPIAPEGGRFQKVACGSLRGGGHLLAPSWP